jgi:periplasmic protein TonB
MRISSKQSLGRSLILGLLAISVLGLIDEATAQSESTKSDGSAVVRTPARVDPKHPLKIGAEYYSAKSVSRGEQGTCFLGLLVDVDGVIRAVQLVQSIGFPRLDAACIQSVVGACMFPATLNGKPVTSWTTFAIDWVLDGSAHHSRPKLLEFAVPRLPDNYELQVGPKFYPVSSRQNKEEGTCLAGVAVDETGEVRDTKVLKSTGFTALHGGCTDALTLARFTPARHEGLAVASQTLVALLWKLH